MKMIAAASLNNVIGLDDIIPWKCREDFKWFRFMTMGDSCLVGRKTYQAMPKLPGRRLTVLSTQKLDEVSCTTLDALQEEVTVYGFYYLPKWVIGGSEIYNLCLERAWISEAYVSRINEEVDGNKYLPDLTKFMKKVSEMKLSDMCTIEKWINI